MKWSKAEKKQLLVFIVIAYGLTYILGLVMWYGYTAGNDVGVFPGAQMLYPAAGVMAAYLLTRKDDHHIPKRFFVSYLVVTLFMALSAVLSQVVRQANWTMISQFILIGGSVVCGILMLTEKAEKRAAYGLKSKNPKTSILCVLLFIELYLLRTAIAYGTSGELGKMAEIAQNPMTWILLLSFFVNLPLGFVAFFGEEYGWRYFLQPLLQHRFGKRAGVLILGVV